MGKYLLYAGILWAAVGLGGRAPECHLYDFHAGKGLRAEMREMQWAPWEGRIYKRLGERKYLVETGGRVVMLDAGRRAGERVACRRLVERIEQEAAESLRKRAEKEGKGAERKKS